MKPSPAVTPTLDIGSLIMTVRGHRVILDADLARIYGVSTKRLNEQVKRNANRFPPDFIFRLTPQELRDLRSQIATANAPGNRSQIATGSARHRDPRLLPYAFTEHGALMAANVLNSERAVEMSVYVIRAFVRMRAEFARHQDLAKRLAEIERTLIGHDGALRDLYAKIRALTTAGSAAQPDRIPRQRSRRPLPDGVRMETTGGSLTMPRIFEDIEQDLLPVLQETLRVLDRADLCVALRTRIPTR